MAKKKKGSRRASKKTAIFAALGVGVAALKAYEGWQGKAGSAPGYKGIMWTTLGIDNKGKLIPAKTVENLAPIAVGVGLSILAAKVSANRYVHLPMIKL